MYIMRGIGSQSSILIAAAPSGELSIANPAPSAAVNASIDEYNAAAIDAGARFNAACRQARASRSAAYAGIRKVLARKVSLCERALRDAPQFAAAVDAGNVAEIRARAQESLGELEKQRARLTASAEAACVETCKNAKAKFQAELAQLAQEYRSNLQGRYPAQ